MTLYLLAALLFVLPAATACKKAPTPQPLTMSATEKNYTELRRRMLREQIAGRGIKEMRLLQAMEKVPRHLFVPEEHRADAYEDRPVPIGYGQTISQPYIVALMTEALALRKGEKVLEVGLGSGYQAAILAEMGAQVYSMDIIPELVKQAQANLSAAGYGQVLLKSGDGYRGWKEHAPFDAIVVTCAPESVPGPLIEQLKEGGRLVIPVGIQGGVQDLILIRKGKDGIKRQVVAPVRFVPMLGESEREKRGKED